VRAEEESSISLLDKARVAERSIHDDANVLYKLYDEQLDADVKFREYIVSHVDEAIECGYLEVYYQPIIRTSTREICNEEALSRWNDPEHGMIAPFRFIPPLEESRQIYKLSLHVVKQALADMRALNERGLPIIPVSVNLSRTDFLACDMVTEIANLVEEAGFEPWVLSIEITESAFTESQELLDTEVKRFHERGFAVWMDDFGSEYSTLNLLEQLDFDLVKLDMRFMRNFTNSGRNAIRNPSPSRTIRYGAPSRQYRSFKSASASIASVSDTLRINSVARANVSGRFSRSPTKSIASRIDVGPIGARRPPVASTPPSASLFPLFPPF
jgi:EAL domain-containing protein (putative c-di-GMP-specific phosphodiesterase class I)